MKKHLVANKLFWFRKMKKPLEVARHSLEEVLKSMTPYMTSFVVISDIVWLKALRCNRRVAKDK
jgi:hypothetical protein